MKKTLKIAGLILAGLVALLLGADFGHSLLRLVYLQNRNYVVLALVLGILGFLLYVGGVVAVCFYPLITKKSNKYISFCRKRWLFWGMSALTICLVAKYMSTAVGQEVVKERLVDFISLDWAVFGIAVTFYSILHAGFFGKDSFSALVFDPDSVVFMFVVFLIDVSLLCTLTCRFYIEDEGDIVTLIIASAAFGVSFIGILFSFLQVVLQVFTRYYLNKEIDDVEEGAIIPDSSSDNQTVAKNEKEGTEGGRPI